MATIVRVLHCLLLPLLLALVTAAHADTGRRVALVIGNGAYQNAPGLPNPPNDAKAVAEALRSLSFEVIEAVDLDQPDMLARVDEFSAKLEGAAVGLFFYAGHGLQVAGENYLVPIDARLQREAQVKLQTLPLETVLSTMESLVPTRLVLLDACRDNPLAQQLKRSMGTSRSQAVGQGLAEVRTAVGTLIAYATGPGDVAADGQGEHSPFASALLDHIGTPGLEVRQVLGRVRSEVLQRTGDRQVPWDSSSLRGEFYFRAAQPEPVVTTGASEPETEKPLLPSTDYGGRDRAAFDAIGESRRARDFAIFLEQYADSPLAPFARSRLEEFSVAQPAKDAQSALSDLDVARADPPSPNLRNGPASAPVEVAAVSPPSQLSQPDSGVSPTERQDLGAIPSQSVDPTPSEIEATLSLSRDRWRKLQQSLTILGFSTRGADGKPGPNTRRALAAWQNSNSIPATGYLGPLQAELIISEARPLVSAAAVAAPKVDDEDTNLITSTAGKAEVSPIHNTEAKLPIHGKVRLSFINAVNVYTERSVTSRRMGSIAGSIMIIGSEERGFVPVLFNDVAAYAVTSDILERMVK